MEQYISKSALVAEIEKLVNHFKTCQTLNSYEDGLKEGRLIGYEDALYKINALKVKEVDLEKELDAYTADNFWALEGNNESPYLVEKDDMLKVAKYFYELGLKAKDVNEIIKTAEDHAYFAGSENTREKLIDKACKWLKENKDHPFIRCEDCCLSGFLTDEFIEEFRKAMEE